MRLYQAVIVSALTTFLIGCIHDSEADQVSNVAFTTVSTGEQIGIPNQQMQVITQADQSSSLLSGLSLSGDIPNPDFALSTIVALFLGDTVGVAGCGGVFTVTRVEDNGETLIIRGRIAAPGVGTACLPVVREERPYVFIQVARTTKPVSLLIDVVTF